MAFIKGENLFEMLNSLIVSGCLPLFLDSLDIVIVGTSLDPIEIHERENQAKN